MGYLIAGRIGTGKTFIVQCWAGELGIPCVVFKNFRDRWVGRDRIEPRKDLRGPARRRPGRGVRRRSRPGGRQARWRRRRQRPVRTRLLDAGQGDVRHAQPRPDHLGLRDVAARPARSGPEAAGPARRPHPALPAADPDDRGAAAGHREKAQVSADRRRFTDLNDGRSSRRQRDRRGPRQRAATARTQ